jgi:hypothetical protein
MGAEGMSSLAKVIIGIVMLLVLSFAVYFLLNFIISNPAL